MSPISHREPGVVGAALNSDIYVELIADTFHVHRALFSFVHKLKGDKLILITDCVMAGGLPSGEYSLGGQDITVKGVECRLKDGTIAGSVLTLNLAIKNMHKYTDIPLYEIVACASLYPARLIGADNVKGSLEIGKDADITIFDGEFNIIKTIIGGAVKYEA
jgi:N-acetylglucosamine-6-phosphate deacetylase